MLVMSMFLLIASVAIIHVLFKVGLINSEKERLVNAADAAAYSGGVFFARNLNFLAYSNRAMLANHVAVGHYISYLSWIRYAHDTVDKADKLANFFPSGKAVTQSAEKIIKSKKILAENLSAGLVSLSEWLNTLIEDAQFKSQFTMNGALSISSFLDVKIMDSVAKSYHSSIRVNHSEDVKAVRPIWIREQILNDMTATLQYVKRYSSRADGGKLYNIVTEKYIRDDPWIQGNRGWKLGIGKIGIFKEGKTKLPGNKHLKWKAEDTLSIKRPSLFGKKTYSFASGQASVNEFKPNYKGVDHYYDRRDSKHTKSIYISALATQSADITGQPDQDGKLWALSRAEIRYKAPEFVGLVDTQEDYSSLYNPFWQVRLTKNNYQ